MEYLNHLNIANNCRACQDRTPDESQIFIFTSARIPDIFKETTSLDIHENDGLPKVLCSTCYNRLLEAYNFRKMCSAAVLHFQKILDATPLNIKTDPDDLDALDARLGNINLPPVREDSASGISDTIFEDERLPELLKAEPDYDVDLLNSRRSQKTNQKGRSLEKKKSIVPGTSGYLECDICNSKFRLKRRLRMHMREKHIKMEPCDNKTHESVQLSKNCKNREWSCERCPIKFSTKKKLQQHMGRIHGRVRNFHCTKCEKSFLTQGNLNIHLLRHEGIKEFKCKICGKLKVTKYELKEHMSTHTKEIRFSCEYCPYKCYKMQRLKQHVKVVHEKIKDFHCTKCEKSFITQGNLNIHLLRHEGIKKFKCKICGKLNVTKCDLKEHMRSHTKEIRFSCEYCPYKCYKMQNLKQHVKVVHEKIKDFHCTKCEKSFSKASTLKVHLLRHEGIKNFKCTICDQMKVTKKELQLHMISHLKKKRLSCKLCSYKTDKKENLKKHVRLVHERVHSFNCPKCERSFAKPSYLSVHLKRHEGIKEFECAICGLMKVTKGELMTHMAIHNKDRKWPCVYCLKKFNTQRSMTFHMKVVHELPKNFRCPYCETSFTRADYLKRHMMYHKGIRNNRKVKSENCVKIK